MKNWRVPLVLMLTATGLAACGSGAADDGRTEVVASFYPAAFLAERIGGDDVTVTSLTAPGAEPHDLELTAKQVIAVKEADVVAYLSQFQAAVDHAVEDAGRPDGTTADIGAGVTRLDLPAGVEDDHDHAEGEEEGHDHEHGAHDPHLWLSPKNMVIAAGTVRDALTKTDPENADTYAANANTLIADLEGLDVDFAAGLKTCERRGFVTSHAAFGYMAAAYDLTQIPISGVDPTAEPNTATLAEITDLVKTEGITTVFTERLASPALAETVARETGATTAVLDPIEGLSDETADQDYLSLMGENLAALRKANSCS